MKTDALYSETNQVNFKVVIKYSFIAIIAVILSNGKIFGSLSPFSIAIVCGLPFKYAFVGFIGSIIGNIIFMNSNMLIFYLVIISICFAIRFLIQRLTKFNIKPLLSATIALGVSLISIISLNLLNRVSGTSFTLLILEGLLAGGLSYFFSNSFSMILEDKHIYDDLKLRISISVLGVSIITALSSLTLFNLNFGIILSTILIFIAIRIGGISYTSITCICVCIALNLYSSQNLRFSIIMIIAGFIASLFYRLNRFAQMGTFLIVSSFLVVLSGSSYFLSFRLIDVFFAIAIGCLITDSHIEKIKQGLKLFVPSHNQIHKNFDSSSASVSSRLKFASQTIEELNDDLSCISKKFNDIDYNNISTIYDAVAERVCKGCSLNLFCWDEHYNDTLKNFNRISDSLRISNEINYDNLPSFFKENCCKEANIIKAINGYYKNFTSNQTNKRQVSETRKIIFEQFSSLSDMLYEVSNELSDISEYDNLLAKKAYEGFISIENAPEEIIATTNKNGRKSIEIYTKSFIKTNKTTIQEVISNYTGTEFDIPSISELKGISRISLYEKALYELEISAQQSCSSNNKVCGDSYEIFNDSKGFAYILLSDGMGTGKRAAIDSVMTCSIISKLIKAGFGFNATLKLLNSALIIKSTDESLATIDFIKVDLFTGNAEFYKAGAVTSYIYSKNKISRIECDNLPIGILETSECIPIKTKFHNGDIIVLTSDGAISSSEDYLSDDIRKNSHLTMKELSTRLCYIAKQKSIKSHPDDISIISIKLNATV